MTSANVKQSNNKFNSEGSYAYLAAVDGIRSWEGTIQEVNEHGIVLTYEARGYRYTTMACWPVIASVDVREEIDGKAAKTDKPEVKPAGSKPAAAAAK